MDELEFNVKMAQKNFKYASKKCAKAKLTFEKANETAMEAYRLLCLARAKRNMRDEGGYER